jgi:ABC-type uncharacterized transport system permease subunit
MIEALFAAVPVAIVIATPLLLAVEGELVAQRSGVINLGVEGLMLSSALAATVAAQATGSILAGIAGGVAGSLLVASIFATAVIRFRADQIVAGTAINLLALGATSVIFRELQLKGSALLPRASFDRPSRRPAARSGCIVPRHSPSRLYSPASRELISRSTSRAASRRTSPRGADSSRSRS